MTEAMPEMLMPEMIPEATEKPKRKRRTKTEMNGLSPDTGYSAPSGESSAPKQTRGIEKQIAEIEIGLVGLFKAGGGVIGYFDAFDGAIIAGTHPLSTMPSFVEAVCRAARTDGRLRGWLLTVVHVSAYSDIALYAAMMLVPILMHHNMIPVGLFTSINDGDDNAG